MGKITTGEFVITSKRAQGNPGHMWTVTYPPDTGVEFYAHGKATTAELTTIARRRLLASGWTPPKVIDGYVVPTSPLCTCAAFDPAHPDESAHTLDDHRSDCSTQPPCGGCWSCMAMTAARWATNRVQGNAMNGIVITSAGPGLTAPLIPAAALLAEMDMPDPPAVRRMAVPAVRMPDGEVCVILPDPGGLGWMMHDTSGTSYWPEGAIELRAFAAEMANDLDCPADERALLVAKYEALAAIVDEVEEAYPSLDPAGLSNAIVALLLHLPDVDQ